MLEIWFDVWFHGVRVKLSRAVERELSDLDLEVQDLIEVLEDGVDCSRSKRKAYKIEKCLRKGEKVIRVVAAYDYNLFLKEEVLVIIHVSKEGKKWLK